MKAHLNGLCILALSIPGFVSACTAPMPDTTAEREAAAERYFRGVYDCDSSVVDELAADSIVASYPIFETLFGEPALRGLETVKAFAERFCTRWLDAEVTIEEMISESDKVVLVWSFEATNAIPGQDGSPPSFERESWGGITIIGFDKDGKIILELGEESGPGPTARVES